MNDNSECGYPFRDDLEKLINKYSRENGSNTPDFILAEYLCDCLAFFDKAVRRREQWYNRDPRWQSKDLEDHPKIPNPIITTTVLNSKSGLIGNGLCRHGHYEEDCKECQLEWYY